jgi:hypothetical protein
MTSMEEKNAMLVMVLTDLAAICKKLSESTAVPQELRERARQFVAEFELLLPVKGRGNNYEHARGEQLLAKIARFLPCVLEVRAEPALNIR